MRRVLPGDDLVGVLHRLRALGGAPGPINVVNAVAVRGRQPLMPPNVPKGRCQAHHQVLADGLPPAAELRRDRKAVPAHEE